MPSIQVNTLVLLLLISIASLPAGSAFVSSGSPHHVISQSTTSELNVGLSFDEDDPYLQLLQRANDCAKDEECSLEEWDSVVTEMEYISNMETEELSGLVQSIHQLEERTALSTWTNSRNLPIVVGMFLFSTLNMLSQDEIVTRILWFFQDWNQVATSSTYNSVHAHQLPLFMCAAAAYVAVSEVVSGFLPQEK